MSRIVVFLLAALCLSGCGMVTSDRPLFASVDARGAPILKEGLWVTMEPGCKFNRRAALAKWPDCAGAFEVRDGRVTDVKPDRRDKSPTPTPYLIAAGDPAILQAEFAADDGGRPTYLYFGVRPLASDPDGVIIGARIWPILCAPPGVHDPQVRGKPARLPPGLVWLKGDQANCLSRTQGPVRKAAVASEAWTFTGAPDDAGLAAHWMRGEPR